MLLKLSLTFSFSLQSIASGLGAFATTFLKAHTWLGEYEGEIFVLEDYQYVTDYAWQSYRNDSMVYYIDGADMRTSNWLRWLNCPRSLAEENVRGLYCYGKVLYVTIKDVYPGQELFVYYGHDYAYRLGIDIDEMGGDLEEWMEYEKEYEEHQKKLGLQENNNYMEADDDSQWVSWGDSQFEWKSIESIQDEGEPSVRREPAKNCKCICTLNENEKETEVENNVDYSNTAKEEHLRKECNTEDKAESDDINTHETQQSPKICDNTSKNINTPDATKHTCDKDKSTDRTKEATSDSDVSHGTQCEINGDKESNTCECDCVIKSKTIDDNTNKDSVTLDEHEYISECCR